MKTTRFTKTLIALSVFLVMQLFAHAGNVTWLNPTSGNWNAGANWSGGSAPGVNDTADITIAGTYTVSMNVSASTAKLVIGNASGIQTLTLNGNVLTIANNSTVNPHGVLDFVNSSTINGAGTLTNNGKIILNSANTIAASVINADTIFVDHASNSVTGNFTTTASSVLYFRCASYISQLTYSNGWTNNGKILMAGPHYYSNLFVTSGVLVNTVGSVIQSLPNGYNYNRIDGVVNNQGTMTIDGSLQIYTPAAASTNTGTVTYAAGNHTLTYYNGTVNWNSAAINFNTGSTLAFSGATLNWNGGAITGTGLFNFESSTGNFNTASMPAQPMYFNSSTLGSILPTITNSKRITLNASNVVSANLNNADTIFVDHASNSVTGNFTTTASSVLYFRCASYISQLTYSNGWTNNGKILMAGPYYYSNLFVTSGVLVNPVGSVIKSSPNGYTYNRIDGVVNNQGTMTIDGSLQIYTPAAASTNTGTVTYAAGNHTLTYYNGTVNWNSAAINFNTGSTLAFSGATLNWNGGTITGTGLFNFESSTGNMNTASMPAQPMYFNSSTLGSILPTITNSKRITLNANNVVSANLNNADTIFVDHASNSVTGNFTTTASSVLYFRCASYISQLTYSNGWTNNGKILMAGPYYYSNLFITSGVLVNPVGSVIQSSPNGYNYNRIDGAVNNQGTMTIDGSLQIYTPAAASTNTGTVTYAAGNHTLTYYNGTVNWNSAAINFNTGSTLAFSGATLNWNGGAITGTGLFNFESSTGNMNTASMPAQPMYFNSSTLGSILPTITNSKRITLNANNVVSANLNNADTIFVDHLSNSVTGNFTTTASSVLYFRCASYISQLTYSNGWTNNGKILMAGPYYYSNLVVTSGVLVNPVGSVIQSSPNGYTYNRIDGAVNNQGTMTIDGSLQIYTPAAASTNTGTVNYTAANATLTYFNGILNWTSGTINFNTGNALAFSNATLNWTSGTITGTGKMIFTSSVVDFNVSVIPLVDIEMTSSSLGSPFLPITSSRKIRLFSNNTITAAVFNTDSILVHHLSNTMTGALTTSTTSLISIDGANYHSDFLVSSGFTNNGLIELKSLVGYNASLGITSGNLINSPSGIIRSYGPGGGTRTLNAALTNQGALITDYSLTIANAGTSSNIGAITIAPSQILTFNGGKFDFNTGSLTGAGTLYFNNCNYGVHVTNIPAVFTQFYSSQLSSSLLLINNTATIELIYGNTVSANVNNKSTGIINVKHSTNTVSGNFSNEAGSLLSVNGANYHADITFNYGFTNNGTIDLKSLVGYNSSLFVTAGEILNLGTIHSYGPSGGTRTLGASINNQGALSVDYTLLISKASALHTNTGAVTIANGQRLTFEFGSLRWNGGTATGTGTLYFNSCIDSVNVANIPNVFTQFYTSQLSSSLALINNTGTIEFIYGNTIVANVNNKSTGIINVLQYANTVSGNFSNETGSLLAVNGATYHADITFNIGFTNNGTIDLKSLVGYNTSLFVTAGEILNLGTIHSYGPSGGTRTLGASINNQGALNVDYTLLISKASAVHTNTGSVTIASGQRLTFDLGSLRWNGGTATGTGTLYFNSCIDSVNVADIPNVFTQYYTSQLRSSLSLINNTATIEFIYGNTIAANVNNKSTGIINVLQYANQVSGNFTNETGSLLAVNGATYHADITFNNGFTNNGTIDLKSLVGYNTSLFVTNGVLTNSSGGVFNSTGPLGGSRNFSGQFVNDGTFNVFYPITCTSSSFVNNAGGIIKGNAQMNVSPARLINYGVISPGLSPGILSLNANLANKSTSQWNIEIGGLTAGTQHDKLLNNFASTTDSIGGALNISLINGFIPSLGDSVVIETHNARVGTFATITGQVIPGGLYWNIFYRTNHISLRAGDPPNLNITSSAGVNGTISPLGIASIVYNGTQTYTMLPNSGYHVDSVIVDGLYAGDSTSYTFNTVQVDHTIRVVFAVTTFPVTASVSANGTISPAGVTNVPQFTNQLYAITANPCYLVDSVFVDGNYAGALNTYTFNNVTAAHSIHAVFRNAPKITAYGPLTFCVGDSVTLDAGSGYTTYSWSNGATTQTTTVNSSNTYTCTITSTGGCSNSTSVVVTVIPLPSVTLAQPFASDNGHTCLSGGGINLSLSGLGQPNGGGYSGVGVFTNFYQFYVPAQAGIGTNSLTYTYSDGNGCTNSDTKQVIVDQNAAVNAGSDILLCNSLVAQLNASANATAGVVTWMSNGTGTFSDLNSLTSTYTLSSADSVSGNILLTLTSADPSGPCSFVSDQVTIVYNPYAIPDAGPAQLCTPPTVVLNGSITGYPATAHWTTTGTGNFANANSLSTTYTASAGDLLIGKVKLILTPIDPQANCTFGSDTLEAWFDPNYSVNAGTDVLLCGINDTVASLNGSFTNALSVTWSNGNGVFSNINSTNSTYRLSASDRANGYIVLSLTTNDPVGACSSVSDDVVVMYKFAIADIPATDVCGDTSTFVSGNVSTNSFSFSTLSYLWTTAGSGFFSSPNTSTSNYTASNADLLAGKVKLYVTPVDGAGQCLYVKDSMNVWFNPHYSVNAGPDSAAICSNGVLNLSGTKVNALSTTWSTSGSGTFGNPALLATTYAPSANDSANGHVTLTLTTNDPNGPCTFSFDSMYVIVHPAPDASAGSNSPVCFGTDLDLTASGGTSYSWTGPNGYASSDQNIIRTPCDYSMAGHYAVVVTNSFGCSNPAATDVVITPCGCTAPNLLEAHVNESCIGGNNGSIDLIPVGGSGGHVYLWSNGATTEDITGLSAGTYTVTVTTTGGCIATKTVVIQLNPCGTTLNLIVFIEGIYIGNNRMIAVLYNGGLNPDSTACDSITFELHKVATPDDIEASGNALLHTNGHAQIIFNALPANQNYYIVIRHRNGMETWSKYPVLFNTLTVNFDFTTP